MLIGGLQPVTLLDYPNKLSAIVFTAGCNMRCPFCYNPNLVLPELITKDKLYKEKEVIDFLKKRKKYLEGLVITGGEPTLQEDLPDFLKKMKEIGYQVKLDTNGINFKILKNIVKDGLIDYLAMDIKGPFDSYDKFCGIKGFKDIEKSIDLIISSGLPYEFRSTLVRGLHELGDMELMAKMIAGAKLYYLQNYRREDKQVSDSFIGAGFSRTDLKEFKEIARRYVEKCIVRAN
jgi:pyruvate formate lyase activating enzyme